MQTGTKQYPETILPPSPDEPFAADRPDEESPRGAIWLLRLVWSRRKLLWRAGVAGVVFGVCLALLLPKSYESITQLMPPDSSQDSGAAMLAALTGRANGSLGSFAGDLLGMKSSGALFIGILRSRTVEDRLIERFELRKVYGTRLDQAARKQLEDNTVITENTKSGIITIKVTDHDPRRAAAIAKAYVDELDRLVAQLSTSSARREREFLEDRLRKVEITLEDAEKQFSEFSSKNNAIDIKEQGRAMVDAAATLQGQLIAATAELEGLRQIYSDNNVRVRATQARIAALQSQINKVTGTGESPSRPGNGGDDRIFPSIRKLPLLGVTYADLYRQAKIQEAVYEALTQQYELAKVQEAKETPSVKVLDEAKVPQKKSYPPRLLITLLCGLLAVGSTAIWVVLTAEWKQLDALDPRKAFAREVFQTANAHAPWSPPNGSRIHDAAHGVWIQIVSRIKRSQDPAGLHKQA